jgi:integrase
LLRTTQRRRNTRKTDYLFLRPGSKNWHIKLQSPDGRKEFSLGTSDRRLADQLANPLIAEHKAKLLAAKPRIEVQWHHEYAPGREHVTSDGTRIIATDRELLFMDSNGAITGTAPNGGPTQVLLGLERRMGIPFPVPIGDADTSRPILLTKNEDDDLFEAYLKEKGISGYFLREARTVWELFKSLCGIRLKDATRDDARKLVNHYADQGLKSASIKKKIGWLVAAANYRIEERKLDYNPFSGLAKLKDDAEKRQPLNDSDIRNAKRNLDRLSKDEQLLFRVLATTGMRLSEPFQIDGELKERGVRYVVIGQKTEQSERRVPLPADVLPFLPKTIKGRLFTGDPKRASKRLNRFLRDIGISDRNKVVHSLRHRAQDRLRAASCPIGIRWELLGHEESTVAEGYGKGSPVPMLKRWIDKIGF